MSSIFEHLLDGHSETVLIELSDSCNNCDEETTSRRIIMPIEILKLAAEIIDGSSFYKDIFDSRIF